MNIGPVDKNDVNRFDDTLRGHHAAAVERISPRVRAQLAQRRIAALRGGGSVGKQGHGFRYAAVAFAAVFALAIGFQLRPARQATMPLAAPASLVAMGGQDRSATTMLDEDPTFYAWLDSSDVRQLAME